MDRVTPKQIISPYSGRPVKPKIIEYEMDGDIYVEARWTCPSSGEFIQKGIVEVRKNPNSATPGVNTDIEKELEDVPYKPSPDPTTEK